MSEKPSLALLLDEPYYRYRDRFTTPFTWGLFAREIGIHFSRATVWVPLKECEREEELKGVSFERKGLEILGHGFYRSISQYYQSRFWRHFQYRGQARQLVADHSIIAVRLPAAIASYLLPWLLKFDKPLVLIAAGDVSKGNPCLVGPRIKQLAMRMAAKGIRRGETHLARQAEMVICHGDALMNLFRPYCLQTVNYRPSLIGKEWLYRREDTCQGNQIRLLRVARLLPLKGLEDLFEAVYILRTHYRKNVTLDVCGAEDDKAYREALVAKINELGLSSFITLHGNIPFGEALRKFYMQADIQVISSLAEGIPRCIIEGAGCCLPLVTTDVGGISSVVRNEENGLMSLPRNPAAVAAAIVRLIQEAPLRQHLIRNGFAEAQVTTLDVQAKHIAEIMTNVCAEHRSCKQ